jgi:hypothetical protein
MTTQAAAACLRAPPRIRTGNLFGLNEVTLPVGLEGRECSQSRKDRAPWIRPGSAITSIRAADRVRTGDLHLGKVSRYLLRHNRMSLGYLSSSPSSGHEARQAAEGVTVTHAL